MSDDCSSCRVLTESREVMYESLDGAIRRLEKNIFSGLHYSIGLTLFSIVGLFVPHMLPFIMVWSDSIPAAMSIVMMLIMYVLISRWMTTFGWKHFIAFPFTTCIFIYTIFRSVFLK
jgi:hypothetical protein